MNVKTEFEPKHEGSTAVETNTAESDTATLLPETEQPEGKADAACTDTIATNALVPDTSKHQNHRDKQYRQGLKTLWRAIILFGGLLVLWAIIDQLL